MFAPLGLSWWRYPGKGFAVAVIISMKLEELKRQSNLKVLFRAKSGYGKTLRSAKIALSVSAEGGPVLYVDTEAEGSTTMVNLIESGRFDEGALENLEYEQVNSYEELMGCIGNDVQRDYDLVVVDTLDHKHTFALRHVTDAQNAADADWNEYPRIYSAEKDVMEAIGKPKANIVATIDPESGKIDKPKGAQTNIHGYFGTVVDLRKTEDGWSHTIRNWVGKSKAIGNKVTDLDEVLTDEILERVDA